MKELARIEADALARVHQATSPRDLQAVRTDVLGKKGRLGAVLRGLGGLSAEERPKVGAAINEVKNRIEEALREANARVAQGAFDAAMRAGAYDVTLPGRRPAPGVAHPLRRVEQEIVSILLPLGFRVAEGPLVEHDWYNFEALNIPQDHPARDMQDTFFVAPNVVLRTHTSNVQIRTMLSQSPPVRILAPGMVFRHDAVDATHSPVFHQIEGLWIDEHATFADLKGVLRHMLEGLFGPDIRMRFRPSFFPFTEPSLEVDMARPSAPDRWLEMGGAGMVDPAVLEHVGYDPELVQGFAFGMGLERLAMLRYGIEDIRLFYDNDLRFLRQFGPTPDGGTL